MRLIGINGFKESGKDTTYGIILKHNPLTRRVAFADKLKTLGALALGFDSQNYSVQELVDKMDECKQDWKFEVWRASKNIKGESEVTNFTGRQYLQWLGANAREVFGDTFWIDQVLPRKRQVYDPGKESGVIYRSDAGSYLGHDALAERYPGTDLVIVTDVRYPNEAERIKDLEGEVWEIIRPGLESDGHSSEVPLPRDLVDRTIHNDDSLEKLEARVLEAL